MPLFSLFSGENELFQVRTFSSLVDGHYGGVYKYEDLFKHGDFGFGTFDGIRGEMVALDGEFYQDSPTGELSRVKPSETTPYAAVLFFNPTGSQNLKSSKSMDQLTNSILPFLEQKNTPYALRIKGRFRHLHLRSLRKQTPPYVKLEEAAKEQYEYDFYDVEGTLVGYYFPSYLDGVNAAGSSFHFHFIDSEKKKGGHVLDASTKSATCDFQLCQDLKIYFPNSEATE